VAAPRKFAGFYAKKAQKAADFAPKTRYFQVFCLPVR
jgi:hypothetical protein